MKHIILAAGQGTRLRPFTDELPKCMVQVEGQSLFERQSDVINCVGINEIILVGGYRHDKLPANYRKYINEDYESTNMLWSLFKAENEFDGGVIVSYGDIVYPPIALERLIQSKDDISVIVDSDWWHYWSLRSGDPLADAESLKLNDSGFITEIGMRPKSLESIEGQYIGLMKFSAHGIKILKEFFLQAIESGLIFNGRDVKKMYMTDMLQCLICSGVKVKGVPINGGWIEVDTVEDLGLPVTASRLKDIKKICNERRV